MKASQGVAITTFSHESVEYYTPIEYIVSARTCMGEIDLDPASCAAAQENVRAACYFTKDDDGLAQEWFGRVWLNPPYSKTGSKSNQAIWAQKLVREFESGRVKEAILLVRAAFGYKWFMELFDAFPVCLVRERIRFVGPDGKSKGQSKQGAAFFYIGRDVDRFKLCFSIFGRVVENNSDR